MEMKLTSAYEKFNFMEALYKKKLGEQSPQTVETESKSKDDLLEMKMKHEKDVNDLKEKQSVHFLEISQSMEKSYKKKIDSLMSAIDNKDQSGIVSVLKNQYAETEDQKDNLVKQMAEIRQNSEKSHANLTDHYEHRLQTLKRRIDIVKSEEQDKIKVACLTQKNSN
jgi:hypothetical protein